MADFAQMAQGALVVAAPVPTSSTTLAESGVGGLIAGVEIVGSGALMAYLNARMPSPGKTHHEIGGYPTDWIVGAGLALAGVFGFAGANSVHLLRMGLGCLCEAGIRAGFEKGVSDRDAPQIAPAKPKLQLVEGRAAAPLAKTASQEVFQPVS